MSTECSYDYVFVYDGDSFESPLIGSFSGKSQPQQVTATSGSVSFDRLIYNLLKWILYTKDLGVCLTLG
jgi:hypothetical protein